MSTVPQIKRKNHNGGKFIYKSFSKLTYFNIVWQIKFKQLIRDSVQVLQLTASLSIQLVQMDKNGVSAQKPEKALLQEVFHQVQERIKLKLKLLILRSQGFSWEKKSKT